MKWPHFLCSLFLIIIIDRIEGPYAVVEWDNLALSSIHRSLLPANLREGQTLHLTIHSQPLGRAYMLHNDPAIFVLSKQQLLIPLSLPLQTDKRYELNFHLPIKGR